MWETDLLQTIVLIVSAVAASAVGAVAGFGGAILLLPALVWVFGVRDAVPILTIAQLVGNGSRAWLNRTDVDLRVVGSYALGAVPFALIGGALFAAAPLSWLVRGVGLFLVSAVAYRRLAGGRYPRLPARGFPAVGGGASLLSALVGSTGPVTAPFFLAYGLIKGAYIGTEAAATVITHIFKLVAYGSMNLVTTPVLLAGLLLAPLMMLGTWVGKQVLDRLSASAFVSLIEVVMITAGVILIVRG